MSPEGGDAPDDFVAGNEGVGGHAPVVVEHGEIAVADAAALHGDLNLFAAEGAGGVFEGLEGLFGAESGEGFDGGAHRWGQGCFWR